MKKKNWDYLSDDNTLNAMPYCEMEWVELMRNDPDNLDKNKLADDYIVFAKKLEASKAAFDVEAPMISRGVMK